MARSRRLRISSPSKQVTPTWRQPSSVPPAMRDLNDNEILERIPGMLLDFTPQSLRCFGFRHSDFPVPMIAALLYLQYHTVKNRLFMRFKRLKQPKYLLGGIVGALYFY